jgi:hypothetical protein
MRSGELLKQELVLGLHVFMLEFQLLVLDSELLILGV